MNTVGTGNPENPYVGLRPFESHHNELFFGRRRQTARLLDELQRTRFLTVVGSSGCGKSSLVRAGLIPVLEAGFLVEDRDLWRIVRVKPGDAPLGNLAAALAEEDDDDAGAFLAAITEEGVEGVEAYLAPRLGEHTSLLLLVDQFEEVFPFREARQEDGRERVRRRSEADEFVDLLLDLAASSEISLYVVVTMRSDFLGDCDVFSGLPEAMNESRFLVPRLRRDELREAIEGPALLRGVEVVPRLVERLLNEFEELTDRLPVLQHVLLRTWNKWRAGGGTGEIDLAAYEAAGTIERALSEHAEEAFREEDHELAAQIFKCLTDTDAGQRRVRRPASLQELVDVTGGSLSEVEAVSERFQADGRHFLVVSDAATPGERWVGISHESLIRQWRRLQRWVDEEKEAREIFRELVQRARRWERGVGALLQALDLPRFQERWDDVRVGWTRRYSNSEGDFSVARNFFRESVEKAQAAAGEWEQRRERWRPVAAAAALMVSVGLGFVITAGRPMFDLAQIDLPSRLFASFESIMTIPNAYFAGFLTASVAGFLTASVEVVSRYRDDPFRAVFTSPAGWIYLVVNAALSAIAYQLLTQSQDLMMSDVEAHLRLALLGGFGAAILVRARIFTVKTGSDEVPVGPGFIIDQLLRILDRQIDRSRAIRRTKMVFSSMADVDFDRVAKYAKTSIPSTSRDLSLEERRILVSRIAEIEGSEVDDVQKRYALGFLVLDFMGEAYLRALLAGVKLSESEPA